MRLKYSLQAIFCLLTVVAAGQHLNGSHVRTGDLPEGAWHAEVHQNDKWRDLMIIPSKGPDAKQMDPETTVRGFIRTHARNLHCASVSLELAQNRSQGDISVVWLRQYERGLPVFDGTVFTAVWRNKVVALHDQTYEAVHDWPMHPNDPEGIRVTLGHQKQGVRFIGFGEVGYYQGQPCYRFNVENASGEATEWMVHAKTGSLLRERPLFHYDKKTGSGYVFYPNPISSTGDTGLTDEQDTAYGALLDAMVEVPLNLLDASGYLRNQYVDLTAPGIPWGSIPGYIAGQANEPSGIFRYDRDDNRFEEVNVYYWITECSRYIAETLGHPEAVDYAVPVNAHYMSADNSYYSEMDRGLHFGDGIVDDAEDAEIVLHEFGHAILHNLIPGLGETWEASAIDEGTCDYVAATFSNDPFFPDTIGEWDATGYDTIHTDPPRLRPIVTDRTYPENMYDPYPLTGLSNFHWDGVIWSATLWQCREHLGSLAMDGILFGALSMFFPGIGFSSAALRLVNSEYFRYAGEHSPTLRYFFNKRGILSDSYVMAPELGPAVNRLVLPLVLENDDYQTLIGVVNPTAVETPATIQVVGDNGCIIYQKAETRIPPYGRHTFQPARGRLPQACWVLIESPEPLNGYALIQSKDGQKSAFIPASTSLYGELLVPHIAPETDYWETETSVVNVSEESAEVRFLENNLPGAAFEATSHPFGQTAFNWLSDYYGGALPDEFSGWGLLTADTQSIAGAEIFHKKGTSLYQMAGLSLSDKGGSVLWFPHIHVQGGYWWTGVVLVNDSDSHRDVTITAWDESGNRLSTLSLPMEAQTKWVSLVQDLWASQGQTMPSNTAWIQAETDAGEISGVELFGTLPTSGDRLLAGVNAAVETSPGLIFPHIILGTENWAGIAFVNVGSHPATCEVAAMNDAGEVLGEFTMTETIPVHAKWVSTARDLFGGNVPEGTTQLRIMSDSELVGFQLWGNIIPRQDHLSGMLAVPCNNN